MWKSAGYPLAALALAVVGAAALASGRVERDLVEAERQMARLDYAGVAEVLARAERFYSRVSWVPLIGDRALNEVRAERAALYYWQRDYAAIVPAVPDPVGSVAADNVDLQFIVANAVFRKGRQDPDDAAAMAQAVDNGIAAQLAVLKNSVRNEDAAFNYEYLLRLRSAALLKRNGSNGADEAGTEKTTHGQPGGAPRESDPTDFKIHIPLESKEFENQKEGQQAGKATERQRKG